MAEQNKNDNDSPDSAEAVERVMAVVVHKRKTIPAKCMDLIREMHSYELMRLENAKVITDGAKRKENFLRTVQGAQGLKSVKFTLDDLKEAKARLQKYHKRTIEINRYLERRKKHLKQI